MLDASAPIHDNQDSVVSVVANDLVQGAELLAQPSLNRLWLGVVSLVQFGTVDVSDASLDWGLAL